MQNNVENQTKYIYFIFTKENTFFYPFEVLVFKSSIYSYRFSNDSS